MNIFFERKAKKFIEHADNLLKEKIKQEVLIIAENPYANKHLHGDLSDFYRHRFSHKGTEYRILYRIEERENLIIAGNRNAREFLS